MKKTMNLILLFTFLIGCTNLNDVLIFDINNEHIKSFDKEVHLKSKYEFKNSIVRFNIKSFLIDRDTMEKIDSEIDVGSVLYSFYNYSTPYTNIISLCTSGKQYEFSPMDIEIPFIPVEYLKEKDLDKYFNYVVIVQSDFYYPEKSKHEECSLLMYSEYKFCVAEPHYFSIPKELNWNVTLLGQYKYTDLPNSLNRNDVLFYIDAWTPYTIFERWLSILRKKGYGRIFLYVNPIEPDLEPKGIDGENHKHIINKPKIEVFNKFDECPVCDGVPQVNSISGIDN